MAVQRDVHTEGRYGPFGPMSPKYKKNAGIEIEAPLTTVSYPNAIPAEKETLPERLSAAIEMKTDIVKLEY